MSYMKKNSSKDHHGRMALAVKKKGILTAMLAVVILAVQVRAESTPMGGFDVDVQPGGGESAKPAPTSIPKPTAVPRPTSVPQPTAAPRPTPAPHPTSAPHPTVMPSPTSVPRPTAVPHPSSKPQSTTAPHPTSKPQSTTAAHPTNAPQSTAAPHPTSVPQATSAPQSAAGPVPGNSALNKSQPGYHPRTDGKAELAADTQPGHKTKAASSQTGIAQSEKAARSDGKSSTGPADGFLFLHSRTKGVGKDDLLEIKIETQQMFLVISCCVNGQETGYGLAGNVLTLKEPRITKGKNVIELRVLSESGRLWEMAPWQISCS